MADQKDLPAEDPTIIPLEKRGIAEKSLPEYIIASKSKSESDSESESESNSDSESESDSDSDISDSGEDKDTKDESAEDFKKKKREELKRKAFYSVLLAFRAEPLTIGKKKTQIIEKLMKEWNITHETRISFEDNIQKNLIAQQQRVDSDVKQMQIVEKAKPLTISEKKPTLIQTSVATPRLSWGNVNPETLVGRRVRIRMPCEDHFEYMLIKEYNPKAGTHRFENLDVNVMCMDEMFNWMDLREFSPEDIRWGDGENPNFETPGLGGGP